MTLLNKIKEIPTTSGIYKLTSPSGKIYIGQSINVQKRLRGYYHNFKFLQEQRRLYNSFMKYGVEAHNFEIVELCTPLQLDEKELEWGLKLKVLGENGLVCRLGHANGKMSEESKKLISKALMGKKQSKETIEKRRAKLIGREVSDLERINKREGKIKQYKESPMGWGNKISISKLNSSYKRSTESNKATGKGNEKPIIQYDKDMNKLNTFISATDAMKQTNIKNDNISHCLRGKSKSAGGFIWKFKL